MKTTLNKITKPVVFGFGIVTIIAFIWTLVFMTPYTGLATNLYKGSLDTTTRTYKQVLQAYFGNTDYIAKWVEVDDFYQAVQSFNQSLFVFSTSMFVLWAICLILSNHSRKKYYKSNLFSGVITSLIAIVFAFVLIVKNINLSVLFNNNKEALEVYNQCTLYGPDTLLPYINDGTMAQRLNSLTSTPFVISTIVLVLHILVSIGNLAFAILKYSTSNRKVEL